MTSINNPDYSKVNKKILFSAQHKGVFHNYLFSLSLDGHLDQLTFDEDYMDFDCSWSEDGTKIVFSRLPKQDYPFLAPSQVWLMDANGSNQVKITDGGPNPNVSRLKTGKQNEPFGVYELVLFDIETSEETVLDSSYANMIPEWKSKGILFIRQLGSSSSVMDRKQSMYVYKDDKFTILEPYPYNVFPIGSNGASWIDE